MKANCGIKVVALAASALLASFVAIAGDVSTWQGGTTGAWSEPTNWNPEGVPEDDATVVIPAGTAVTLPEDLSDETVVTGEGTVSVCSNDQLERLVGQLFAGTIAVASGKSVDLASLGSLASAGLKLADGSKLTLPTAVLGKGGREAMLSWADDVSHWTTNGFTWNTYVHASGKERVDFTSHIAYVEEGTGDMILTDTPAEKNTVIYTHRRFHRADDWEFTVTATMSYEGLGDRLSAAGYGQISAEGFHVLLQADGPNVVGGKDGGRPNTSYGFFIHPYHDSAENRKLRWIEKGSIVNGEDVQESELDGINLFGTVEYNVRCADGIMYVTLRQGTKEAKLRRDISAFFDSYDSVGGFLTFYGYSGNWPVTSSTVAWIHTRMSDFSGSYRTAEQTLATFPGTRTPIAADTWNLNPKCSTPSVSSSATMLGDGYLQLVPDANTKWGQANCRTPLKSFKTPFRATYSFHTEGSTYKTHAEGFGFALQPDGVDSAIDWYGDGRIWNLNGYGVVFKGYEVAAGIFDAKTKPATLSPSRDSYKYQSIDGVFTVDYDGLGGISYSATWKSVDAENAESTSGSKVMSDTYATYKDNPMYLSFTGATSTWGCNGFFAVSNLVLYTWQNAAATVDPLTVAAGATANLVAGGYMTDSGVAADLQALNLEAGSTLALTPELDASRVRARQVALAGSGTISIGAEVTFDLENVTFTASTPESLTLAGSGTLAFGSAIEIVVPRAAIAASPNHSRIVSFAGVSKLGAVPETMTLKDETGKVYLNRLAFASDGIYLNRVATILFVR